MISKDYFIVGIRLLGLWELLRAVDYGIEGFDMQAGFFRSRDIILGATYTHGLAYLMVGIYLLGCAPQFARFFYPLPRPTEAEPSFTPPTL